MTCVTGLWEVLKKQLWKDITWLVVDLLLQQNPTTINKTVTNFKFIVLSGLPKQI